ncbi:MAG: biopolymer transporter ExbD [Planctomycetota bacterium]
MKLAQSRTFANAPLPLIGMIDAFFLLLIYFLVSSTLTPAEEELAAALAARSQDASQADLEPQIVEVLPDGRGFTISGREVPDQRALTSLLSGLPKQAGVFVVAPDEASVSAVAQALQAAEDAGFERLTYVTPE